MAALPYIFANDSGPVSAAQLDSNFNFIAAANLAAVPPWTLPDDSIYLGGDGQSNELGSGGPPPDPTILPGILIWNGLPKASGGAWVVPQWGQPPLSSGGNDNLLIQTANALVRLNVFPGRTIKLILNAVSGQPITRWTHPYYPDALGYAGYDTMWQSFVTQCRDAGIPRLDGYMRYQGEADSTTACTLLPGIVDQTPALPRHIDWQLIPSPPAGTQLRQPAANTQATMLLNLLGDGSVNPLADPTFQPLLPRLKTLTNAAGDPLWQAWTPFLCNELGPWYDCANLRNDAIKVLALQGDPLVGSISAFGFDRSPDSGDVDHLDAIYFANAGLRRALSLIRAWAGRTITDYAPRASNGNVAASPTQLGLIAGSYTGTYLVKDLDFVNGAHVTTSPGDVVNITNAVRSPGGWFSVYHLGGGTATLSCAQPFRFNGRDDQTTISLTPEGTYTFRDQDGRWTQVVDPYTVAGLLDIGTFSPTAVTTLQDARVKVQGNGAYLDGDIVTVPLPAGGTGTPGTLRLVVDGSGVIQGLDVDTPGTYTPNVQQFSSTAATPIAVTGGTGSGLTVEIPHVGYADFVNQWFQATSSIMVPYANGITRGACGVINAQPTTAATATWSSGASTITVTSASGIYVGQAVSSASGIASGATVTEITGLVVSLSIATTGLATAQAVTFTASNILFATAGGLIQRGAGLPLAQLTLPPGGWVIVQPLGNARLYVVDTNVGEAVLFGSGIQRVTPVPIDLTTTNATPTAMPGYVIPTSHNGWLDIVIIANSGNDKGGAIFRAYVSRDASGNARLQRKTTVEGYLGENTISTAAVDYTITGTSLIITVTGVAATTINWSAKIADLYKNA